jgi:hypothetical protein
MSSCVVPRTVVPRWEVGPPKQRVRGDVEGNVAPGGSPRVDDRPAGALGGRGGAGAALDLYGHLPVGRRRAAGTIRLVAKGRRGGAEGDLPPGLAKPAQRALAQAGISRLEHLTKLSAAEVLRLHGMGPKAMDQLRRALAAAGQSFAG